jgi:NAD(P) transhydrogenase subunit alpha
LARLELAEKLAERGVSALALDMVPRITRAQAMDVLSSQATLAGYKAVLLAADTLGRICPLMMTAAGTLRPAQALIIGAGVAGLQAIATAKRLGAVVTAVDVRPSVQEQIESLGARFVAMEVSHEAETSGGYARDLGEDFYREEQEIIAPVLKTADMLISTAQIPGRVAPLLVTAAMVEQMKPGSVIVDLAAPSGGNCAVTEADQRVECAGVTVLGPTNLPSALPVHASQMFSQNLAALLGELLDDQGRLDLSADNEILHGMLITRGGEVVHPKVRDAMGLGELLPEQVPDTGPAEAVAAPPAQEPARTDGLAGPPEEKPEHGTDEVTT